MLLFTKTNSGGTDNVWFYDMKADGFSLDDKRQPVPESDLPDLLACYPKRFDAAFQAGRRERLVALRAQDAPLAEAPGAERGVSVWPFQDDLAALARLDDVVSQDGRDRGQVEIRDRVQAGLRCLTTRPCRRLWGRFRL